MWRNLYSGKVTLDQLNGTGRGVSKKIRRCSLLEAAKRIGYSKKSLDDYLLQLRFGRKFGFDFDRHQNDKVGVLRTFVKNQKQILK